MWRHKTLVKLSLNDSRMHNIIFCFPKWWSQSYNQECWVTSPDYSNAIKGKLDCSKLEHIINVTCSGALSRRFCSFPPIQRRSFFLTFTRAELQCLEINWLEEESNLTLLSVPWRWVRELWNSEADFFKMISISIFAIRNNRAVNSLRV